MKPGIRHANPVVTKKTSKDDYTFNWRTQRFEAKPKKKPTTETFTLIRGDSVSMGFFPDANLIVKKVSTTGPAKNAGLTQKHLGLKVIFVDGVRVHSLKDYRRLVHDKDTFDVTISKPTPVTLNRQAIRRRKAAATILEDTRLFIQDLVQLSSNKIVFTEEDLHARQLCYSIERCFIFGLKPAWYGGNVSFWKFFAAASKKTSSNQLISDISEIEKLDVLNNNGKGRALIRIALKKMAMTEFLVEFTRDFAHAQSWYYPWSIIGNRSNLEIFMKILATLSQIEAPLVMQFDDFKLLNSVPEWILDWDQIPRLKTKRKVLSKNSRPANIPLNVDSTQLDRNRRLFEAQYGPASSGSDSEDAGTTISSTGPSTPVIDGPSTAELQAARLRWRHDICDQIVKDVEKSITNLIQYPETEITESCEDAQNFCRVIEKAFLFGIKHESYIQGGKPSFFHFLVDSCQEYSSYGFLVDKLKEDDKFNEYGKGRAFIRLALVQRSFTDFFTDLVSNTELLTNHYFTWSVLGNQNYIDRMKISLRGLKLVLSNHSFKLKTEIEALNPDDLWQVDEHLLLYYFTEEMPVLEPELPKSPHHLDSKTFNLTGSNSEHRKESWQSAHSLSREKPSMSPALSGATFDPLASPKSNAEFDPLASPKSAHDTNFEPLASPSYGGGDTSVRSYESHRSVLENLAPNMPEFGAQSVMDQVNAFPPGYYKVLVNTWTTEGVSVKSRPKQNLDISQIVQVIDVKLHQAERRIRAELANGEWITLKKVDEEEYFVQPCELSQEQMDFRLLERGISSRPVRLRRANEPREQTGPSILDTFSSMVKKMKKKTPTAQPKPVPMGGPLINLDLTGSGDSTKEKPENPEEAKDSLGDIPDPDTPFTIESGSEEEPLEGADANASDNEQAIDSELQIKIDAVFTGTSPDQDKKVVYDQELQKQIDIVFTGVSQNQDKGENVIDQELQKQIDDVFTGASRSQEKRDPETPKKKEVDVDNMKFESPLTNLLNQDANIAHVPVISEEEINSLERSWMTDEVIEKRSPKVSKNRKGGGYENAFDDLMKKDKFDNYVKEVDGMNKNSLAAIISDEEEDFVEAAREQEEIIQAPVKAVSMANLVDADVGRGMRKVTEYIDEEDDDSYDSLEEDLMDPNVMIIETREVDESEDLPPDMRANTINNPFLKREKQSTRKKITRIIKHQAPEPVQNPSHSPAPSPDPSHSPKPLASSNPFSMKPDTNPFRSTQSRSPSNASNNPFRMNESVDDTFEEDIDDTFDEDFEEPVRKQSYANRSLQDRNNLIEKLAADYGRKKG